MRDRARYGRAAVLLARSSLSIAKRKEKDYVQFRPKPTRRVKTTTKRPVQPLQTA